MCGILGLYNLEMYLSVFPKMMARLAHRGPDAEGSYHFQHNQISVALGHKRLSIIDLSETANQPFQKNGLVLVFNGEIYNYRALRMELERLGVIFLTQSDTEVVLEAWRRWGPEALQRFRGMFAFGLFDEKTGCLYLARDHFGIKPLFLYKGRDGFAFSSELKGLKPLFDGSPPVDDIALIASLLYVWIPESHCVYKGIERFPVGHWAKITPDGRIRMKSYWNPQELLYQPEGEISLEELREVIENSVKAHMVSDVPVSTFLSGGLDSSLITILAARVSASIDSYTIKFRDIDKKFEAMPDDYHYARWISDRFGIRLHEIVIDPDVVSMLPKMVSILDEPIGDSATINTYLICEAARQQGVKVLLSGMGADEIFAGYRRHSANRLAALYRKVPAFIRGGLVSPLVGRMSVGDENRGYRLVRWAKRFLQFANEPEEAAFRRSYTYYSLSDLHQLLEPSYWPLVDRLVEEHAEVYWNATHVDHVNRMCFTDLQMFLPGLNLTYSDRASMAVSTEVRVPYVDLEVVKAAFRIKGGRKIVGMQGKSVLKKAAEAWLPKKIIYRPKASFSVPLRSWIRKELRPMIDDLLGQDCLLGKGFIRVDAMQKIIKQDRAGLADNAQRIWQFLTLECWYRNVLKH